MSWCCFGGSMEKKGHNSSHYLKEISGTLPQNIKLFPYKELSSATNHFHPSNKLGRGGFGTVYKGILRGGAPVAIKVLSAESRQGVREFLTEIETVTNVKHPNLVEIIGCCVQQKDRILVYEYVENNSLDRALLSKRNATIKMDWAKRSAICLGIARGLAFLHEEVEPPIVHRDIKASNILLDKDLLPKIGDFGLAKIFPENLTHISTRVAGTTGYLAPEYAMGGQLTKKADVYSFGVLLIEIISGRSSAKENWGGAERHALEWVWHLHKEGRLLELADTELVQYPEDELLRYLKIALFCTQAAASRRPQMTQVVKMLSRDVRLNEKELTVPGYFQDSTKNSSGSASSSNKNMVSDISSEPVSYFPSAITQVNAR